MKSKFTAADLNYVGVNGPVGENYGWACGERSDYFVDLETGKVVAEVYERATPVAPNDRLYGVTLLTKFVDGKPLQPTFYVSRSAARDAVEDELGDETQPQTALIASRSRNSASN